MVDWTKEERYAIENVEHQIHILGVKTPVWPYVIASFAFSLWINPLLFFLGPLVVVLLARKFWEAEQIGRPIEYEKWFAEKLGKYKIVKEFFPCITSLKHSQNRYR